MANHSCVPNAVVVFPLGAGRGVEIVAIGEIGKGEEVRAVVELCSSLIFAETPVSLCCSITLSLCFSVTLSPVLLPHCSSDPLTLCPPVPLSLCRTVFLSQCSSVPLCHCSTVPLSFCFTVRSLCMRVSQIDRVETG